MKTMITGPPMAAAAIVARGTASSYRPGPVAMTLDNAALTLHRWLQHAGRVALATACGAAA